MKKREQKHKNNLIKISMSHPFVKEWRLSSLGKEMEKAMAKKGLHHAWQQVSKVQHSYQFSALYVPLVDKKGRSAGGSVFATRKSDTIPMTSSVAISLIFAGDKVNVLNQQGRILATVHIGNKLLLQQGNVPSSSFWDCFWRCFGDKTIPTCAIVCSACRFAPPITPPQVRAAACAACLVCLGADAAWCLFRCGYWGE